MLLRLLVNRLCLSLCYGLKGRLRYIACLQPNATSLVFSCHCNVIDQAELALSGGAGGLSKPAHTRLFGKLRVRSSSAWFELHVAVQHRELVCLSIGQPAVCQISSYAEPITFLGRFDQGSPVKAKYVAFPSIRLCCKKLIASVAITLVYENVWHVTGSRSCQRYTESC